MRRAFSPVNELKPLDVKMMLSEIQIERKRISLGEVLMEGMKNKVFLILIVVDNVSANSIYYIFDTC